MEKINEVMTQGYVSITNSLHQEEGQGMVEYGLIIVIVSIAAIVGLGLLGTELNTVFTTIKDDLIPAT